MTSLDLSFECAKVVIFADGKGMVCEVLWFLGRKKSDEGRKWALCIYSCSFLPSLDKIGGISTEKINEFILFCLRFALSLQLML